MPQPYCINFRFWGFPVTIHPFFWLIAVFIGGGQNGGIDDLAVSLRGIAVWVAAFFVALMVHELGHALVFRYVFHVNASIVLHGMGGYASPHYPPQRRRGWRGFGSFLLLYAAGVGAGFLLALLAYLILQVTPPAGDNVVAQMIYLWLLYILGIGVVWGIFNLLPIIPLDGGHISREICCALMPRKGHRFALYLSIVCAVGLIGLALQYHQNIFLIIIFGYFAFLNYQELLRGTPGSPRF